MKVGIFTVLLSQMPLNRVFEHIKAPEIDTVESSTGNYPGDAHCKLSMLQDLSALGDFKKMLSDHGISISALSCHGNPLHPVESRAQTARKVSRDTIVLAEKLGVPSVVDFSGCPGDSAQSTAPNWVSLAAGLPRSAGLAVGQGSNALLDGAGGFRSRSWCTHRDRDAPGLRGV